LRERLRLSNDENKKLIAYARLLTILKTRPLPVDATAIRRLVAEQGVETLASVLAATAGEPVPVVRKDALEAFERFGRGDEPVPVFPLRGADLVEGGIPKGPRVGELLSLARQAWLAEGCLTDKASARSLLRRILDQAQA
jgi:poly(A) polymerase